MLGMFTSLPQRFSTPPKKVDLMGGVTTAIVSLPLALAFGVASGAGASAGLYGAVCVGLFASLFGSSKPLISEPTGPMTVIMTTVFASLTAQYPEQGLAMGFTVVMVAGVFQYMLGKLRLGQFITLMPYGVISGFMSGIGLILIILQLPLLIGSVAPPGGVLSVISGLPDILASMKAWDVVLGVAAVALLLTYPKKWRSIVPSQLVLLTLGTLLSMVLIDPDGIRRIGTIPMGLPDLHWPVFELDVVTRILLDGMVLGILGALDTVITALISDNLTHENHDSDRELMGQGIGNLIAGICGGLPGAGATMGTVVNIQNGTRTPWGGVFRALILLGILLGAGTLLSPIPMCILAAIAIKVGMDILDWSFMKRAHKVSRSSTLIMYGVMILTVFVDLVVAVGVGVFIANMLTIQKLSKLHSGDIRSYSDHEELDELNAEERSILEECKGRIALLMLDGPMIFGVSKAISNQRSSIGWSRALVLDLHNVPYLGLTASLSLETLITELHDDGGRVLIVGASSAIRERFESLGIMSMSRVKEVDSRKEGLDDARDFLQREERHQLPSSTS
jgi:sulfate permease, SulP family